MPGDRLTWFPCYPADILLSPRVARMSAAEFGVYMRLLLHVYRSGDGMISSRPEDLAFYAGTGAELETIQAVLPLFQPAETEGFLTHEHAAEFFEKASLKASQVASKASRNSDNGRKGGLQSGKSRRRSKMEANASSGHEAKNEARSPEQIISEQNKTDFDPAAVPYVPASQDASKPQVKPGATSAPESPKPIQFRTTPPEQPGAPLNGIPGLRSSLTRERIASAVARSIPANASDMDQFRPWVSKAFARWFADLKLPDQLAVGEIWEAENPGVGFDTGPQRRQNGPVVSIHGGRPTDATTASACRMAGIPEADSPLEFDGGEI